MGSVQMDQGESCCPESTISMRESGWIFFVFSQLFQQACFRPIVLSSECSESSEELQIVLLVGKRKAKSAPTVKTESKIVHERSVSLLPKSRAFQMLSHSFHQTKPVQVACIDVQEISTFVRAGTGFRHLPH